MGRFEVYDENGKVSRISEGTAVKGEIVSPNDVRIDGVFEGRMIVRGKVTVGNGSSVNGDVICHNAEFRGKVDGNVYVKDTLVLKDGCSVNACLGIRRLAVELGATFNGSCKMISEDEFDAVSGEGDVADKEN